MTNITKIIESVVKITCQNNNFDFQKPYIFDSVNPSIGSGFLISHKGQKYIITCYHVISNSIDTHALFYHHQSKIPLTIIGVAPEIDVAILQTKDTNFLSNIPTLTLSNILPVFTSLARAIGYPLNSGLKVTDGTVSGKYQYMIQVSTPMNVGVSGGPMINKDGEVMGLCTAKLTEKNVENVGLIIPSTLINAHLDRLVAKSDKINLVFMPNLLCKLNKIYPTYFDYLKISPELKKQINNKGGIIKELHSSTNLYQSGVRENDILLSINGSEIDENLNSEILIDDLIIRSHINNVVKQFPINNSHIPITYYSVNKKKIINTNFILDTIELIKTREKYPCVEMDTINQEWDIIGGFVISQLNENLLESFEHNSEMIKLIPKFKYPLKYQNHLVISNILPLSSLIDIETIHVGSILTHVNGHPVNNIVNFRKAFLDINDSFIVLTFEGLGDVMLKIEDILNQELNSSVKFKHPISTLYCALKDKIPSFKAKIDICYPTIGKKI